MTIIKRCEKEVHGSWSDKQQQAKTWLTQFVPHYSGRCSAAIGTDGDTGTDGDNHCPAKHGATDDNSKRWLDREHASDKAKIAALEQLINRMKADVALYIHGYNTCAVECAHGERTVLTSKRIEYWSNWEGKCRLVQLLHNNRPKATGEWLLQRLGWQVVDGVSTQLGKIDRDKTKHRQLKTSSAYNGRQKAIRAEKKTRTAADPELIARAATQKQKTREKQRHYYSAKKQLLYQAEAGKTGAVAGDAVVRKKRGRPRKTVQPAEDGAKENVDPRTLSETASRKRVKFVAALGGAEAGADSERRVLQALMTNRTVRVRLVL